MSIGEYAKLSRPSSVSLDEMRAVWETNVFGVLAVYQAMLPLLREAPQARIVNVSSGVGSLTMNSDPTYPYRSIFGPVYPASKTALNASDRSPRAIELESTGIKVPSPPPWALRRRTSATTRARRLSRRKARGGCRGGRALPCRTGRPDRYVLAREARTAPRDRAKPQDLSVQAAIDIYRPCQPDGVVSSSLPALSSLYERRDTDSGFDRAWRPKRG